MEATGGLWGARRALGSKLLSCPCDDFQVMGQPPVDLTSGATSVSQDFWRTPPYSGSHLYSVTRRLNAQSPRPLLALLSWAEMP